MRDVGIQAVVLLSRKPFARRVDPVAIAVDIAQRIGAKSGPQLPFKKSGVEQRVGSNVTIPPVSQKMAPSGMGLLSSQKGLSVPILKKQVASVPFRSAIQYRRKIAPPPKVAPAQTPNPPTPHVWPTRTWPRPNRTICDCQLEAIEALSFATPGAFNLPARIACSIRIGYPASFP